MTDGSVEQSRRRLADAVHAFADPLPIWDTGECRWLAPMYQRLRDALRCQPRNTGHRPPSSRMPCRGDVLALLVDVDDAAAEWTPKLRDADTPKRLRALAAMPSRPQDCERIDGYTAKLQGWTLTAGELLGDRAPEVALRFPCPSCGRQFVSRTNHGERVRTWTLRVSEAGARCLGCDASWQPEQFGFLAKLLGCPELPT